MQNYYPWNTEALLEWLKQELNNPENQGAETTLQVPRHVIRAWLTEPSPTITLAHIRAIAQHRGWNLNQIIDWLQLQPAHVQDLINQDIAEAS
ncbi:hypothetical protein [Nodosilinea nodulosa]|uniref:hypothetical protein n=1 Tax=Nodosilinea nodulosa TaxID=416001 RepID=UPI0003188772|nr:hypothetical protein [Nodosilinea nodulosa]